MEHFYLFPSPSTFICSEVPEMFCGLYLVFDGMWPESWSKPQYQPLSCCHIVYIQTSIICMYLHPIIHLIVETAKTLAGK